MKKTMRVYATKQTKQEGKTTTVYYTYSHYNEKKEQWYEVKFGQETNGPKKEGYWLIEFETAKCNIEKNRKSKTTGNPINDCLWVHECYGFEEDVEYVKQLDAERERMLGEMFD